MDNGDVYECEWKNSVPEGFGQIKIDGNLKYKGEFKKGKRHGIGIEISENLIYEREF